MTPLKNTRLRLLLVMAVALVPLGLAYLLYYLLQGGVPWATTNHGQFLDPFVDADTLALRDTSGDRVELKGYWHLMLISDGDCVRDCATAMHQLQALQILVGKDADRIKRMLVFTGSSAGVAAERISAAGEAILQRYPDLKLAMAGSLPLTRGLYVVDPLGNIILRYEYKQADKGLLTDLKKLLKVSQIG